MRRLKAAQTALTPKVQELRDVADWQRWANVGIQEQLCEKMEALKALEDPEEIARQVRDLQQQWRQAADVPRAQGEALWKRFKTAHDEAWAKCEAHFAAQAGGARRESREEDRALRARRGARRFDQLDSGPPKRSRRCRPSGRRSARSRAARRKPSGSASAPPAIASSPAVTPISPSARRCGPRTWRRRKRSCAKAEALQDSTDWDAAAAEIKRLQAEWKTIGPVKKSRSEALWQRFRAACDHFFARYAQRHDIAQGRAGRGARGDRRRARSAGAGADEPDRAAAGRGRRADSGRRPRGCRGAVRDARWQQAVELAARGVDRDRAVALDQRFAAAFARVVARWPAAFAGTDLDPDANRKRMETLVREDGGSREVARRSGGRHAGDAALSPTTRLAAMLKEALAANTIGGKVDNDSRFRAAAEEVRQAQASWSRIGPVPDDASARSPTASSARLPAHRERGAAHGRGASALAGSGRCGGRRSGRADRRAGQVDYEASSPRHGSSESYLDPRTSVPAVRRLPPLLDLDQLDVEHEHAVRRAACLCRQGSRESRSASSRLRTSAAGLRSSPGSRRRPGTSPARRARPSCRTSCRRSSSPCSSRSPSRSRAGAVRRRPL